MAKVLVVSIAPIFPAHVHGGSQKILDVIVNYLAVQNHSVVIHCTSRVDIPSHFQLNRKVEVFADLEFKQPFPDPYAAPITDLARAFDTLNKASREADYVYNHDGSIFYHEIFAEKPLVVSIRDLIYSVSLVGLFSFRRDQLVVNSTYSYETVLGLAGQFLPGLRNRMHVIPNGIDGQIFHPLNKRSCRRRLKLDPDAICLLSPHRTEVGKGFELLLRVVIQLENKIARPLNVVIPRWIDGRISPGVDEYLRNLREKWARSGIRSGLTVIDWLPQSMMKYLYSACDITLCLGDIPEAFGSNVALESLACGVPIVCLSVGSYRTTLPKEWLLISESNNECEIVQLIKCGLQGVKKPTREVIRNILTDFSMSKMLAAYSDVIFTTKVNQPLQWTHQSHATVREYAQAPWCATLANSYYDDFERTYTPPDEIHRFLKLLNGKPFTMAEAKGYGLTSKQIRSAVRRGVILPCNDNFSGQQESGSSRNRTNKTSR